MKNILIHGLGQSETSWQVCKRTLEENGMETETPNLYAMIKGERAVYDGLLQQFTAYCNAFGDKLNLCGLSLGGILALDYAKRFPDKINSIILIGVPYTVPKFLFRLQGAIFHLMPRQSFTKMGVEKNDFISLVGSMGALDIASNLDALCCNTLLLCGEADRQNRKSAALLHAHIPQSTLQIVAHASHEVNTDNPKDLAEIIHAFWRTQP